MRFAGVYCDRDGVLNVERFDYVYHPEQLVLVPGAAPAVRRLNLAGLPVVLVTNQSGVGKGLYTAGDLAAVHDRLQQELARHGAHLDAILVCPHRREDGCTCRKPRPGLLLEGAARCGFDPQAGVLVGDNLTDLQAAHAAGATAILVRSGRGLAVEEQLPDSAVQPDQVRDDLAAAVDWILAP